jgi:hypothetical protein
LRQGGALPARAALDPRGLGGVLDRVFLVERIGRGLGQIRIAGSALVEWAGIDLRGLPLSCLFAPDSRPVLALALEEVFSGPVIAGIELGSDRGQSGLAVARMVLLPLAEGGGVRSALGVIGLTESGRGGRFQVLSRQSERLEIPERTAAVAARGVIPEPRPEGRHRHLTLVHSS